ncbi:5'-nucleotidase C-terminal domain-containing protein [Gulosibacter sp. 10]|uniref:5'-nucleotidase C-terminal domain-containing protein n=1 Tax=Gulosibacter sp. 10 TaxID=1255570 RepID=UPI00097EB882|nr:5'-nucleotidase C-terminal domain-containing protein [Gulosibacter sp. 10]SJM60722.1 5'-nucleotidase [Gulosibacter sp. 10]
MAQVPKLVKGGVATVAGCALAVTGLVLPAQADVASPDIIEPTDGSTQINLLGYNDFHGRITQVEPFAETILSAEQAFGEENTLIISHGDQFGASEFESSVAQDVPSVDALLALGTDHFTAGNHEFDNGYDNRGEGVNGVLQGAQGINDLLEQAGGLYAANVELRADGSKPFKGYETYEIQGQTVAVISAVTASTPSGVNPDGIADIRFTDPVEAVNEVAEALSDGDDANDEADVIIASYHEGGPFNQTEVGSLEEYTERSSLFDSLVNGTDPAVNAIFHAHSHKAYAYDAPVPGGNEGQTRPVIQAGEYAGNVSQVVLDISDEGTVSASSSSVIPAGTTTDEPLGESAQARLDEVVDIRDKAIEEAEVLGAEQIGVVEEDITSAQVWENGSATARDDRGEESSLGGVVADSMLGWANAETENGADLSIMNPGGLRADIDGDGVLTYKDAQLVLPFVNNLSVVTISGAELKNVFEEQWQIDENGEVPGRSYLQLGVSSNVNYSYAGSTSDDPLTSQGDHITSLYIDGEPIADDELYDVVMPSFLAAGGDNFLSLQNAESVFDTGSVDLDAFKAYVQGLPDQTLEPDTTRNGFSVNGYFDDEKNAPSVEAGGELTFTVENVDLKSKGFVANESVVVTLDGEEIGSGELEGVTENGEDNSAQVTITVPETVEPGDYELEIVAQPSESTVQVPLTVTEGDQAAEPVVKTEKDNYTQAETVDGVPYAGANWAPDYYVEVTVTTPEGEAELDPLETDENGVFEGLLIYSTYDEATGEIIEENVEFPVGEYTLTVTQDVPADAEGVSTADAEQLTASTTFTVGDPDDTPVPTPTDDADADSSGTDGNADSSGDDGTADSSGSADDGAAGNADGGNGDDQADQDGDLAQTGADSNLIFGLLAAAAAAIALGATALVMRRQRKA